MSSNQWVILISIIAIIWFITGLLASNIAIMSSVQNLNSLILKLNSAFVTNTYKHDSLFFDDVNLINSYSNLDLDNSNLSYVNSV